MMLANKRPIDFQLKVKSHPGMLIITSLNKMYFTDEIELSFSGTNPLTHQFVKTERVMKHNFDCYQQFFTSLVKSKCPIDESDFPLSHNIFLFSNLYSSYYHLILLVIGCSLSINLTIISTLCFLRIMVCPDKTRDTIS